MARILVVDDNHLLRTIIRDVLMKAGHAVEEAEDGQQAMARIRLHRPDLIVTDYYMPNMMGDELVEMLRRSPEFRTMPVIGLAGTKSSQQHLIEAGVDAFIPKPMKALEFVSTVNEVLAKTRPPAEASDAPRDR